MLYSLAKPPCVFLQRRGIDFETLENTCTDVGLAIISRRLRPPAAAVRRNHRSPPRSGRCGHARRVCRRLRCPRCQGQGACAVITACSPPRHFCCLVLFPTELGGALWCLLLAPGGFCRTVVASWASLWRFGRLRAPRGYSGV
jgi:hypothetical protein